ncbi:MAG: hypothetical protein PVH68_17380 [Armatimonadota bacterium]|jgi:hypothetical protein
MLDERYLLRGLDALSRAHSTNYFADGHRGAGIVSAYYLCREHEVEDGAARIVAEMIDENWTDTELCAPFPRERPDIALLGRVVAALDGNMGRLRQAGHNVIFPSLALRALHDLPEAVTPSRVEGVCKLIEAFDTADDITLDESDDIPDFGPPEGLAEFILAEYPRTTKAFVERGQGWSGHMLTYGRALADLALLGYTELATKGHHAFKLYVKRTRMGPLETDKPRPEHAPTPLMPLQAAYWERRRQHDPAIGHCFKYPYGFYGLLALAQDPSLEQEYLAEAFRVL